MTIEDKNQREYRAITSAVDLGHVSILLGNGIDLAISDQGWTWKDLLQTLADELRIDSPEVRKLLAEKRFLLAADYFSAPPRYHEYRAALEQALKKVRWSPTPERQLLMKLISFLNPRCILTTNYTQSIEDGLRDVGVDVFSVKEDDDLVRMEAQSARPLIYVHGTCSSPEPVLRYADYFHHRDRNPKLWSLIRTVFQSNSMIALGIALGESEFDIYESLYLSRIESGAASSKHLLITPSKSDAMANVMTTALAERFGLQIVTEPMEAGESYLSFYIRALSRILEYSNRPYVGINTRSVETMSVFCGLFKRDVIVYPKFTGKKSDLLVEMERDAENADLRLPNSTIYNEAIIENPGGAATVAAAAYAKLGSGSSKKTAVIFAKGLSARLRTEELGSSIGVCLDGVELSDKDMPTVIINRPNTEDGDERLILDIRAHGVYDGHKAVLDNEELATIQLERLGNRCKAVYFDRWGSAWLPGAKKLLGHNSRLPVFLDTGWTGGTQRDDKIVPESDLGDVVTHVLASIPPFERYVRFALAKSICELQLDEPVCWSEVFDAIRNRLFPRLRFICVTRGAEPVICIFKRLGQNAGGVDGFLLPSIQTSEGLPPLNPLGCGDIWRGAFTWSIVLRPDDYRFAACLGTITAFWHLVGGIDRTTGRSSLLRGIPESIPTKSDIAGVLAIDNVEEISKWKNDVRESAGMIVERILTFDDADGQNSSLGGESTVSTK